MKTFETIYHYWAIDDDRLIVNTFGRMPDDKYIMLGNHTVEIEYDESLVSDRKRFSKASKLAALQLEIDELKECEA